MCLISGADNTILASDGQCNKRDVSNVAIEVSDKENRNVKIATQSTSKSTVTSMPTLLPWLTVVVWPLMSTLPLLLTSENLPTHYSKIFPSEWYKQDATNEQPMPLGLILGILAVVVGHMFVLPIFYIYRQGTLSGGVKPTSIQTKGERKYEFLEGLKTHLTQPEGFVLLSIYLSSTWMMGLMPKSYYSFDEGIKWSRVLLCLATQDFVQYIMHRFEHCFSFEIYKKSHKPHHRFTNPRLFDAFNGSVADTILMILIPLYITANIVRDCNVWTYMVFGSMYANWLVLIHSEYVFPWDSSFRALGLGTPGDHHVHHKLFVYNYGHLFLWFDQLGGTYRSPNQYAPKIFNPGT